MPSSGNFCTLNPLAQPNSGTYSEGNLLFTHTTNDWRTSSGTLAVSSGKWYWEAYQYESLSGNGFPVGIYDISGGKLVSNQASSYPGRTTSTYGLGYAVYSNSGSYASKYTNQSETNTSLSIGVSGDVWQCALDLDNNKLWFGKNNTWDNSANPALGTNQSYAIDSGKEYVPVTCSYNDSGSENFPQNFGQDSTFSGRISAGGNADGNGFGDFKYAPPSGFLALCSANLPISADIDPAQTSDDIPTKQFGILTWTGNGATGRAITGLGFQPDFIWFKDRTQAFSHRLYDTSRGIASNGGKRLFSNNSNAETDQTSGQDISAVGADGITLGASDANYTNYNTDANVAWCWRAAGGTTATNNDGSITSSVQANTKSGFSIITWTASGSNGSIGHGLSAKPDFHIIKKRNSSSGWIVYHTSLGATKFLRLDETGSASSNQYLYNNTEPTSTVINLGDNGGTNHPSGDTYICYAWHSVKGFSSFGSFEGNSNADGPFIYTGFRPRLVFCKAADATENWQVRDTARSTFNANSQVRIYWNSSSAEGSASTASPIDFLSNGFKVRGSNTEINSNTIVYGAWGDVPAKYPNTFN